MLKFATIDAKRCGNDFISTMPKYPRFCPNYNVFGRVFKAVMRAKHAKNPLTTDSFQKRLTNDSFCIDIRTVVFATNKR